MRRIFLPLAIAGLLHGQSASAPALVMEAFQKAYPQAKLKTVKAEKHKGKTAYEFEGTNASGSLEALFSDQGELIEAEESIPVAEIPSEVIAAIKAKKPNTTMLRAKKDTSSSGIKFGKREVTLDSTGRFSQERAGESARDGEVVDLLTRSGDLPDLKLLRFSVDHGEGMYVGDEFVCEVEPG